LDTPPLMEGDPLLRMAIRRKTKRDDADSCTWKAQEESEQQEESRLWAFDPA